MLPNDMKEQIRTTFGHEGLYVRDEMANYIFGFRQKKLDQVLAKAWRGYTGEPLPEVAITSLRIADEVWREMVKLAKLTEVVRAPAVLAGNIFSNMMIHLAEGVPLSYVLKNVRTAIYAMRKYQKQDERLKKLRFDAMAAKTDSEARRIQAEMARLKQSMDANPVGQLVEEGLFSPIVEDINPSEYDLKTRPIARTLHKLTEKIPEGISSKVKEAYMLPGSQMFQTAMLATAYSDFVSRFVKYKYMTEVKKFDSEAALNESLDTFIYYREPDSPWLKFANDYGFMMYTKFLLGSQRVAARLWVDNPAGSLGAYLAASAMGQDTVGVHFGRIDTAIERIDPFPPWELPGRVMPGGIMPPIFDWIPIPMPFAS
jgi:hypothetical protein